MTSIQLAHPLSQPTLLKGVYYSTHKAVVMQYVLWYALTAETWTYGDADEPHRSREFHNYLKALGLG